MRKSRRDPTPGGCRLKLLAVHNNSIIPFWFLPFIRTMGFVVRFSCARLLLQTVFGAIAAAANPFSSPVILYFPIGFRICRHWQLPARLPIHIVDAIVVSTVSSLVDWIDEDHLERLRHQQCANNMTSMPFNIRKEKHFILNYSTFNHFRIWHLVSRVNVARWDENDW